MGAIYTGADRNSGPAYNPGGGGNFAPPAWLQQPPPDQKKPGTDPTGNIYVSDSGRSPANSPGANPAAYSGSSANIPGYTPGQPGDQGAGPGATPEFTGAAGRYTAYLNRLPIGQAGAGTDPALISAVQGGLSAGAPSNPYIAQGAADNAQSRGLEAMGIGNLATAGGDNARLQSGIIQQGLDAAGQVRGQQMTLAQQALTAGQPFEQGQEGLAGLLAAGALGNGPSAAQAQLQSGLQQNIAAQHALAAGVRGQGAAAANRNAVNAGQDLALQSQAQAAALRAQEQQAAQAALGNVLAQGRAGAQAGVGLAGDITGALRQGDVATMVGAGNLAGAARGQDIGQANAVTDALGNLRGQDITAAGTLGGLQNTANGIGVEQHGMALNAALGLNGQRLQGLGMDMNGLLSAGTIMANADQGVRGDNIKQELGADKLTQDYITGGAGLGYGLFSGSMGWLKGH